MCLTACSQWNSSTSVPQIRSTHSNRPASYSILCLHSCSDLFNIIPDPLGLITTSTCRKSTTFRMKKGHALFHLLSLGHFKDSWPGQVPHPGYSTVLGLLAQIVSAERVPGNHLFLMCHCTEGPEMWGAKCLAWHPLRSAVKRILGWR